MKTILPWMLTTVAATLVLATPLKTYAGSPVSKTWVDEDGLEWEEEVPEVIQADDQKGIDVNIDDASQFDSDLPDEEEQAPRAARSSARGKLLKKRVDQLIADSCREIQKKTRILREERITKTTQYYTPVFTAGPNGALQEKDRRACINVEGSCLVGNYLYNWSGQGNPWGKRYVRSEVPFKFGKGSGQSYYNTTNSLDPCRTVAADTSVYPTGTVVYIPTMTGKLCPQNGRPVDGCFVVGDIGGAIKGRGRFDLFIGECTSYDKRTNSCNDSLMEHFVAKKGDLFYVIGRHNMLAKTLREEADLHINNDWLSGLFPQF